MSGQRLLALAVLGCLLGAAPANAQEAAPPGEAGAEAPATPATMGSAPAATPLAPAGGAVAASAPQPTAQPAGGASTSAGVEPAPAPSAWDAGASERGHPMAMRTRLIGAYRAGFGGTVDYEVDDMFGLGGHSHGHGSPVVTQALMGRLEAAVGPYFALGAMLQGSVVNTEEAQRTHETPASLFDLGLVMRGRYTFDFGTVGLEPSLAIPVGFTVGVFDKDLSGQPGFGWHIGLLAGGQILLGGHFGIVVELGWMRQRVKIKDDLFTAHVTVSQATLVTGLVVAFGADG